MDLSSYLNIATVSCLFFLALVALFKKSSTPAGYWFLSFLFIILAFNFVDEVLAKEGFYLSHPYLTVIFQPGLYCFGPAIYLAVVHLTSVRKKISRSTILHFIPYFLAVGLYLLSYFPDTSADMSAREVEHSENKTLDIILLSLFFIQMSCYLYFSNRQLKKHLKTLPLFVSNIDDNDYHWLRNTVIGITLLSVISLAEVLFNQPPPSLYFSGCYLVVFYYVGIQVVNQKEVFPFSKEQTESVLELIDEENALPEHEHDGTEEASESKSPEEIADDNPESESKAPEHKKPVISPEKTEFYKLRLLELIETEKPYLDSEITLPKLGNLLGLNTYQTSYLINTGFHENFFTFINRYRIAECKYMLTNKKWDHLSVLAIAFEAGFNSKTAFNTAFKKSTGLSPKEFRAQKNPISSSE
jgi:AraC-like DNA-binding protein